MYLKSLRSKILQCSHRAQAFKLAMIICGAGVRAGRAVKAFDVEGTSFFSVVFGLPSVFGLTHQLLNWRAKHSRRPSAFRRTPPKKFQPARRNLGLFPH
jgi:hypothetical protein